MQLDMAPGLKLLFCTQRSGTTRAFESLLLIGSSFPSSTDLLARVFDDSVELCKRKNRFRVGSAWQEPSHEVFNADHPDDICATNGARLEQSL